MKNETNEVSKYYFAFSCLLCNFVLFMFRFHKIFILILISRNTAIHSGSFIGNINGFNFNLLYLIIIISLYLDNLERNQGIRRVGVKCKVYNSIHPHPLYPVSQSEYQYPLSIHILSERMRAKVHE
jgi:hypothetical protein